MTGSPRIEAYLSEVAAALPGPARGRSDILAELRSGLLDATDAYRAAGHSPGEAAAAATAEFGDPRQVAAAFRPELAARQARRTALTLISTGPLVGLLWAAAATASHIAIHRAPPWQWHGMPPATPIAIPLFGALFVTFMCAALLTVAATGSLTRWLPAGPRAAPATAPIFAAATASLARLTLARRAARLCLTARAALS